MRYIKIVLGLGLVVLAMALVHVGEAHAGHTHVLMAMSIFGLKGPYPLETPNTPGAPTLKSLRTMPFGGYDVYEDVLYDTETWPQASLTPKTPLVFYNSQSNDITLTNLPNGILPSPQMFHAQRLFLQPQVVTAVGNVVLTAAGLAADLDNIFQASRSFFQYQNPATNKLRGPIPLHMIGAAGGIIPVYGGNNVPAAAAGAVIQSARLSQHGGFPVNLIIFATEQLVWQVIAGNQVALTTAGIPIQVNHYGWRYLRGG